MARNKDIPRVQNPPQGDGHHVTWRYMTAAELAEREAGQNAYDAMLARQEAFERSREVAAKKPQAVRAGCVFAKSCKLPDAIIDYSNPSGMVPTDSLKDYGELILLGAREADPSGGIPLRKISANAIPVGFGSLALAGSAFEALPALVSSAAAAPLVGLVALLMPSSLGDSALYTDEQLSTLKQARTRVRLRVEQQADGSLKGYGFYTGKNRDWEMVDVVQFTARGDRFAADLGEGVELLWTPAVDGSDILGIPALEAAPQAPHIWVYPPTKAVDGILVNPVYPPEYRDFILVFPASSGVKPLYAVLNTTRKGLAPVGHSYHQPPTTEQITAFPDLKKVKDKNPVQGGGGLRKRWTDAKGRRIYEWDSRHGELEMYRDDGAHLGAFDPYTGEQREGPIKERSIKKRYL
ncbi:S-type pyocin domain-containing protein [Pseudomonas granadensis]|uniref:colicin E3/pyocin S6 family cytotoxin n=1 Tax=Pseudomonas granadensis TaxID=1421430 RepID=UPI0019D0B063|nr:S-type pyocin domain-containing protein [Pseudomonas granadensis]MBN6806742.1 S-type pyocin domain-containing protein [Pseudomonas granadensis]MBN6833601.1 S-type pyocin domain-containing protein [Pseudomonas granadensis]MBN6840988.1 S-type pyocin domain-containing protein [Pseudomonas granadensis]MBN6866609.1 S-type pyocin domain-containing protein [Pseudomonas granadensis]